MQEPDRDAPDLKESPTPDTETEDDGLNDWRAQIHQLTPEDKDGDTLDERGAKRVSTATQINSQLDALRDDVLRSILSEAVSTTQAPADAANLQVPDQRQVLEHLSKVQTYLVEQLEEMFMPSCEHLC